MRRDWCHADLGAAPLSTSAQAPSSRPATSYDYDAADQLSSVSGALSLTYTYDANGNRIAAGADTFQYDWRDRLVEATVGSVTTTYDHDGDDLRVARDDGTTATDYRWDRAAGLPELVGAGGTDVVHGPVGPLAEVATDTVYPLRDGLGSLRTRTDDTGAVVGTTDWDAWGNLRAGSGTQGDLGWAGELRDADTGLAYLRARDYSPGNGHFTGRDTVSPNGPGTQGYNPYAYALNNPVTLADPTGDMATTQLNLLANVTWDKATGFKIAFAGTGSAYATLPLLNMIGWSVGSALAIVAFYLLFFIALIRLVNATVQWCRANDTCASFAGSVWAFLRYTVDGAYSKVEQGYGWAAGTASSAVSSYANTMACAPDGGPHGEGIAVQVPDQCKEPCPPSETAHAGSTSTDFASLPTDVLAATTGDSTNSGDCKCPEVYRETKTDRIIRDHLTAEDLDAAKRELSGEVVAIRPDGTPFDHVNEVREAQVGLKNRIQQIQKQLQTSNLAYCERIALEAEMSKASKMLDYSEKFVPS